MAGKVYLATVSLFLVLIFCSSASGELVRGAATLSKVSSVIKISREGNGLDSLVPGEILYIFTDAGEPVSQVIVKDIFSDVIHSEPLPDAVARRIRETGSILIFSNAREYGDFIKAFRVGSVASLNEFISRYPHSELREEAQRISDGLVYRPFKIRGTPQAFDEFIKNNPGNYYTEIARKRRDDLLYMPIKAVNRVNQYRWFLTNYPENYNSAEARRIISDLHSIYEETKLEDIAADPRSYLWKKVKFSSTLHSVLPIYVEGESVGRKTAKFKSPRDAGQYLNFQVSIRDIVLWRLFVNREDTFVVDIIEKARKGDRLQVYGMVFTNLGGAPWIDVDDVLKY